MDQKFFALSGINRHPVRFLLLSDDRSASGDGVRPAEGSKRPDGRSHGPEPPCGRHGPRDAPVRAWRGAIRSGSRAMLFDDPILGMVPAQTATGSGIYARIPVLKGQQLYRVEGSLRAKPTRHSVQIAPALHVDPGRASWRHINHACDANLVIDSSDWRFRAVRDIQEDEQLTLNYLNTELERVSPFDCRCGAHDCFGFIGGYARLDAVRRLRLQAHLADHLRHVPLGLPTTPSPVRKLTPADFGIRG